MQVFQTSNKSHRNPATRGSMSMGVGYVFYQNIEMHYGVLGFREMADDVQVFDGS